MRLVLRVVWVGVMLAGYLGIGWFFDLETRTRGLLSPGGAPHVEVMVLGLVYLTARVLVRVLTPLLLVHAAVSAITDRLRPR
jgi:hypothetical protein